MNTILALGLILFAGFFCARFINKIKFPSVTAYLILGILIGPYVLNIIPKDLIGTSGFISNIVLSLIAFTIGQNFSRDTFLRIGRSIIWISVLEACGAWILVTFVFLLILRQPLYISLLFGAISAATAPAATLMVAREYNAKGPFTETLLGVVAIDDAWCLIIFAVSLAVSKGIYAHMSGSYMLIKTIFKALAEILGSFILGGCAGFTLNKLSRYIRTHGELLTYILGLILICSGLSIQLQLSVLLTNMFLGTVLVNIKQEENSRFFDVLKNIDHPLYLIFFVLAGAHLDISLLTRLGLIGTAYTLFRVAGKALGAWLGGKISHAEAGIRKYMGLALVPQAGVALGTALIAQAQFPEAGNFILTTIVATTVVYEIIGPLCTKIALKKAGEIG